MCNDSLEASAGRFWKYVHRSEGCWEWTGSLSTGGYGRLVVNGRLEGAHRLSWVMHFGAIPAGMLICHKCDNRKCIRPDHLFLGTYSDNALDREQKGRGRPNRGERNPNRKLSEAEVVEILRRLNLGCGVGVLADEYGVGSTQIRRIRDGESWPHLAGRV